MTNQQISPTIASLNSKQVLVEQHAMAKTKANKLGYHNHDIDYDPIAAALKQMHDAVTSEELPDDFLRLLDEIDTKIASKKAGH